MKKTLLLALFLASCAQHVTKSPHIISMQMIDRNGQTETISQQHRIKVLEKQDYAKPQAYDKILRVYSKNQDGKNPSIITTYHKNGWLFQQLEAIDGRAHGSYKELYDTGAIKIDAHIIEGTADLTPLAQSTWVFDGLCRIYFPNGQLQAEFNYDRGKKEGKAYYYHENGQLQKEISFKDDLAEGDIYEYNKQGVLTHLYSFAKGMQHGESKAFKENGDLLFHETWQQDQLIQGSYYQKKGEIIASIQQGSGFKALYENERLTSLIEYKKGVIDGKVQDFDDSGRLRHIYHVCANQKHGEEIIYYDHSTTVKVSLSWQNDQISGIVKTYYSDGSLESQRTYHANKKNGPSSVFYPTGELMMLETYSQDRLVEGKYYKKGDNMPSSVVEEGTGCVKIFDEWGGVKQEIHYEKSKIVLPED